MLTSLSAPMGTKEVYPFEHDLPVPDLLGESEDRLVALPSLAADVSHPTATPSMKPSMHKVPVTVQVARVPPQLLYIRYQGFYPSHSHVLAMIKLHNCMFFTHFHILN